MTPSEASNRVKDLSNEIATLINQLDMTNITPVIENSLEHFIVVAEQQLINIREELAK